MCALALRCFTKLLRLCYESMDAFVEYTDVHILDVPPLAATVSTHAVTLIPALRSRTSCAAASPYVVTAPPGEVNRTSYNKQGIISKKGSGAEASVHSVRPPCERRQHKMNGNRSCVSTHALVRSRSAWSHTIACWQRCLKARSGV